MRVCRFSDEITTAGELRDFLEMYEDDEEITFKLRLNSEIRQIEISIDQYHEKEIIFA